MITNVSIRTNKPELIEFFYPNYTKTNQYSPFISGGVIFDGDAKYLQMFRDNSIPYIYVKGTPEYDLTIPSNLLQFVFDKWDKKPTNALSEYFNTLDYKRNADEIDTICKQIWVTGKYTLDVEKEETISKFYDMLSTRGTTELLQNYLELSDNINQERMFYKVQSFLDKLGDIDEVKSPYLKLKLKSFKLSRGQNVQKALMNYLYSNIDNSELKMLNLLDNLTNINRRD
jgi:hypothetical protein